MALVVFLRGVNVGGHKTFRPSMLAEQLKDYNVVNVGAAGTFVIRKPISQVQLRAELLRRLPFEAEVMICNGHDLISLASGDPFAGEPPRPDVVRFVSVLAKRAGAEERSVSQISELLLRRGVEAYKREGSKYLQRFLSRQKKEDPSE
jgi:uncharacterized protein (DUF1697 family)